MRVRSSLVLALAISGCASARPAAPPVAAPPPPVAAPALFVFHAGFWVNLHQRLYAESGARAVPDPLRAATAEEQAAWDGAVAFYRQRYADRGILTLLENEELVEVDRQTRLAETLPDLAQSRLPAEVRANLETAAAVYRRAAWPEDERADRQHIARVEPLVQRFGPSLVTALSRAYETPWPAKPVRVDVAMYAGPLAAYTIDSITMAAHDRRHEGDAVLEVLFHEASHLLIDRVGHVIVERCAAQGKRVPPTLWHALLFFGTGEVVRRTLGDTYVPYGDRQGLWQRSRDWAALRPVLGRVWPQYLDGKITLSAAVDEIVATLP
jgi:hypothetical protein